MALHRSIVFAVPDFLPLLPVARSAEAAGYHRIWTTENPGRDALVRALVIAMSTRTIGVGTGIAYAFTRSPLAMAAAASDIFTASDGRFSLGVGAGTQGMRSRWYGVDEFDHPATRLAEYATLMRTAWAAEKNYEHDGQFYRGSYPELDGVRAAVPLWGSGINAAMLRSAARSFDGVALHPLGASVKYLEAVVLPSVREGAAASAAQPELAIWRITSIDDDGDLARRRARKSLAFYFSTPSYGTVAEQTGWGPVAQAIREAFLAEGPQWQKHADLVPEGMVEEFSLAGTPEEVRAAWPAVERAYEGVGATEVVFQAVAGDDEPKDAAANLMNIVEVLAPAPSSSGATALSKLL